MIPILRIWKAICSYLTFKPKGKIFRKLAKHPHEDEDDLQRRLKKRCEHEAAHIILLDEHGYQTKRVSVALNRKQKAEPDYRGDDEVLLSADWNDPSQREAMKQIVFDLCDCFVAGHLAENEGMYPDVPKVSDRISAEMLAAGKPGQEDAQLVCEYLKKIGCNSQKHVLEAEDRARQVLGRRANQHRALADALYENDVLEWNDIKPLIGK